MNTKTKLALLAGPLALGLCACGGQNNYLPDPVDSNWTAYQQVIVAHPGMECVMVWSHAGVYEYPCYPMGTAIPYATRVYYPRTGYCGCWSVAAKPAGYRDTRVNKTTYNKTVINNTTVNNNSNNKTTTNNKPASPPKTGSTTNLNKGTSSTSRSTGTSGRR